MSQRQREDARIPGTLNVTLSLTGYAAAAGLLWLGSRGGLRALAAALAFSFLANTLFSLLHESVHGLFHPNRHVNDAFGCMSAAFFPTGFSFQRICHLGHHRRNRTDAELFDYYRPGESRWLKAYRLYSLLTGFYWLAIPVGALAYLLLGPLAMRPGFRRLVAATGLDPMLEDLARARPARLRLELLLSFGVQVLLVLGLGLTLRGWLLCYGAFALNWCALQYTDHAFTIRDIRNGASNLRVNRLVQYVFLNYHHHLAHHQHPQVPWIHLPRLVKADSERPGFLRTYLQLWAGPRLSLEPAPGPIDPVLDQDLR
jgi:fatty acid desaturase